MSALESMQTRKQSLVESLTNVAVGYIVAVLSQLAVFPLFGITVSISDNLLIGLYFTVISLVRGYLIRRYFNKQHKGVNNENGYCSR